MVSEQQRTFMSPTRYSQWFILVTAVFITCLITANITAVKLVGVFGLILPAPAAGRFVSGLSGR
jgi:hypothetical protein